MLYILEVSRIYAAPVSVPTLFLLSIPIPVSSVCISAVYPGVISVIIFSMYLTLSSVALYTFGSFQILDIRKP